MDGSMIDRGAALGHDLLNGGICYAFAEASILDRALVPRRHCLVLNDRFDFGVVREASATPRHERMGYTRLHA
jgi:hypothetical protein